MITRIRSVILLVGIISTVWADGIPPSVPEIYHDIYSPSSSSYEDKEGKTRLPYEQIEIERSGSDYGSKLTLYRTGKAVLLTASADFSEVARKEGRINMNLYARICYAFDEARFMDLEDGYLPNWTHAPTCTVVVKKNGEIKTVVDAGEMAPIRLWILQRMLDGIREQIDWAPGMKKEPNQSPEPMPLKRHGSP